MYQCILHAPKTVSKQTGLVVTKSRRSYQFTNSMNHEVAAWFQSNHTNFSHLSRQPLVWQQHAHENTMPSWNLHSRTNSKMMYAPNPYIYHFEEGIQFQEPKNEFETTDH